MDLLLLISQLVIIIVILAYVAKTANLLQRLEQEQKATRTENHRLKIVVEELIRKINPNQKAPADHQETALRTKHKTTCEAIKPGHAEDSDLITKKAECAPSPPPLPKPALISNSPATTISDSQQQNIITTKPDQNRPHLNTAQNMLNRMLWWILTGEEERPKKQSMEYAIASTWLTRAGIILIVTFMALFLKWSIDRNLIGPQARIIMSAIFGIGLIIAGTRLIGKKYHLLAQGFLGGGILILYFSGYAAGPMYSIVSLPVAFGLLIAVTTATWLIAIRTDSMLVAILGIAGGFATPLMLNTTPEANLPILYGYMLMLNIGILAVAHSRSWPLLNYLGFILTYTIFIYSQIMGYDQNKFPLTISFISAVFIIHSIIVYLYNLRRRQPSNAIEIIHLMANAWIFAGLAYLLINDACGGSYPAIISIGLAIFYGLHVVVFIHRKLNDRNLLAALIALTGAFAAWTMPLLFEKESLTIAFALLAAAFLWISRRIGSSLLHNISHLVYAIVFFRLADSLTTGFGPTAADNAEAYWQAMFSRLWTFGITIGSMALAFRLERQPAHQNPSIATAADSRQYLPQKAGGQIFYWLTAACLFLYLHREINQLFTLWESFRLPALTILWGVTGLYFLFMADRRNSNPNTMLMVMSTLALAAVIKLLTIDLASWNFCNTWYYNTTYSTISVTARLLDFGSVMLFFALAAYRLSSLAEHRRLRNIFGYTATMLLSLYTTLELKTMLHWFAPGFQAGGISILWALYAIAFTSIGIWRNIRPLRYTGLMLFAIVAGKIFLIDLRHMPMIFRIIAFFAVGIILLLGAFAYIFANKKFKLEAAIKAKTDSDQPHTTKPTNKP